MPHETTHRRLRVPIIGRFAPPFGKDYIAVEATSAIAIGIAVVVALVWSNSPWSHSYAQLWSHELTVGSGSLAITHPLNQWVNEGLMAVFFFVVGIELKRELVRGELRTFRAAALPVIAAVGGIAVPALIFVALNAGGPHLRAWAVPTTTDTAFAVGLLALFGSRVAPNVKVLLLSIAIVDDLGAILMIAFVYSHTIHVVWIGISVLVIGVVVALRRVGVTSPVAYVFPAVALWIAISEAGFHATVAGVILGFLTPANPIRGRPVLDQLEHGLHPWAGLLVVPVFALANAGMTLDAHSLRGAFGSLGIGIALGLAIGKLVGILGFSHVALRSGVASLPDGVRTTDLVGIAAIAGVGFSVSLFIAELAVASPDLGAAKIGILVGSAASAVLGCALLSRRGVSTRASQ
jgi:NhaA family Na+:H+ antiporter